MKPSRRDFLATTAALPLVTVQAKQAAPPAARKGLRIGTVTYNIAKDWDVPTIIKNLTEVGMEAVELRTTHAHGVEIALSAEKRAEVKRLFADSPVAIGGLGTTCEYHAADPAVVRRNIEETKQWVLLARDLGSPSVKVRPNGLPPGVPEEKTLEQIGRSLRECGAFAHDHGVRIQLEVHGRDTARLPRIKKILDHSGDHPGVWICWNSNQEDLLDGGLESNFRLVQHKIGQVHMRDLYAEEYPWRKLIGLLQGIKLQGYCFAELGNPSTDGVRVLRYFRGMFRAFEGVV
ncbi:MAG: sugar phosphate isomerase/epimerase family protein [Acidobacteriota bacterium]